MPPAPSRPTGMLPWSEGANLLRVPCRTRQPRGASILPRHSQLDLSLFKLLQDHLPPARAIAGGEFSHCHTPESLD